MGTAKATKAADKSQVCRKLVTALQKLYGKSVPRIELSVVETMLFAACLEDNPWGLAEDSLRKLLSTYFDLNEIRVSSVTELEQTLAPLKDADWKGLRIRSILRFVFETTYSYDYEKLRRQTLEQAVKTLKKVNDITPFIRDFVLHEILGSHVVCLDTSMLTAAKWLGLLPARADIADASEILKGGVKKSEVSEFCFLLRSLATDPKYTARFLDPPETELSMDDVQERLLELQSPPKKKAIKSPPPVETLASKGEKSVSGKKTAAVADKLSSAKNAHPPKAPVSSRNSSIASKSPSRPAVSSAKSASAKPLPKTTSTKTIAKPSGKSVSGTSARSDGSANSSRKSTPDSTKPTPKKPKK